MRASCEAETELMSNGAARMILATATADLPKTFEQTGFHPIDGGQAVSALAASGLWLGPRPVLEETPAYRQIIPYVVLRYGDSFVRYTRTPAGGEARLHGRMSIGLGGHIDLSDIIAVDDAVDLAATVEAASERELEEELGAVVTRDRQWIGVLVDNESSVGRVHVGLVGLWTLASLPSSIPEDAIGDVTLCTVAMLEASRDRLEGWSELLLDHLAAVVQVEREFQAA